MSMTAARPLLALAPAGHDEGGVASFARQLAGAMGSPPPLFLERGGRGIARLRAALASQPPTAAVLLHYVNYGFALRGCPLRVVASLARWRRSTARGSLVTLFHEVHASGAPWKSSFWLQPLQRALARLLARTSDASVTSNALFGTMLERWTPGERVRVLPVFSTAGEDVETIPWSERAPHVVIFGSAGVRARAYRSELDALSQAVRALEVREIVDIGPPCDAPLAVADVPVVRDGFLSAAALASRLRLARYGFLSYPPSLLDKSTVYAAYEAYGLCPVIAWSGEDPGPAVGENQHWLRAEQVKKGEHENPTAIAERARRRYALHSLSRHAELHRELVVRCAS